MEKENVEIIREILGKCNWYQKFIIRNNKKLVLNIYHLGRIKGINKILE